MAQTQSVGIGINNPNPKSVLHLFAPQGNQGLLLPKLTTAQMEENSFKNSLTVAEKGLMVYDTDRSQMFTWDGSQWKSSSKFSFPIIDTIRSSPGSPNNLIRIVYEGNENESVGIIHAENRNPNNSFSSYFGLTTSSINGVADFIINNPLNTNDGIGVVTNGIGRAGAFRVNNMNNEAAGVFSITNGKVGSSALHGQNTGLGRAGFFDITNVNNNSEALSAYSKGTGKAASFISDNETAEDVAIYASRNSNTGRSVILAENKGVGSAVVGIINNGGAGSAIVGISNSSSFLSAGVYGEHNGTGDVAGSFRIKNSSNTFSALYGETNGSGPAIFGNQIGLGRGGQFQIGNQDNSEPALRGYTNGTGRAGFFTIDNVNSSSAGLFVSNNGTGSTIFGQSIGNGEAGRFEIIDPNNNKSAVEIYSKSQSANGLSVVLEGGNTGDAIFAQKTAGFGSAGNFQNQNASNEASILFASTNAPGGSALGAGNFANGNALVLWGGGLRLSTGTLNGGGNISIRSAAYEIIGGNAYTFEFPLSNGEAFFIYNNTVNPVTVNGISIDGNAGKTFIVLNGVLRSI